MARSVVPFTHVDAFAARPFAGNPAAVCLLLEMQPDSWLQAVAAEMNLSETAFLVRREDHFDLRWFTPVAEVDLCGHATLASAHALWESGDALPREPIRFETRSGPLICERGGADGVEPPGEGGRGWIWMDFPAVPACPLDRPPTELVEAVEGAFGVAPRWLGKSRFDLLVEVGSEDEVRTLSPDSARVAEIDARGVIVTAASAGHDFVSRFFAPRVGVPEDPVTGSAHCCLAPFWAERLGRNRLVGYQASRRGGVVRMVLDGDRVGLGGQAVTVLSGRLTA